MKKYEYRKSICKLRTSAHRLFIETGRYTNIPEMKEYLKIVQIKKLKMKLTFSLDVQNLVGREMIFSIPYQLKLKILPIYLIKINYFGCWIVKIRRSLLEDFFTKTCPNYYYIFILYTLCIYNMFVCHVLSIINSFPLVSLYV